MLMIALAVIQFNVGWMDSALCQSLAQTSIALDFHM